MRVFVKPLVAAGLCGGAAIGVYALAERLLAHQRLDTLLAIAAAVVVYFAAILLLGCLDEEDFELIPKERSIYALLHKIKLVR